MKVQLNDQQEIIKKLMEQTQASQMKQMEAKHERETKALNSQQAKISVETAKEVTSVGLINNRKINCDTFSCSTLQVTNDKALKTKGEKDRRLREKKQNNIKRFMEEKKVSVTSWCRRAGPLTRSAQKFHSISEISFLTHLGL